MKTSKIISGALATVMVASTLAIGGVSASAATVKKPTKVKAVNSKTGIKITWKKVKGAGKYKVYRGKKVLKTVKKAKYIDKKAKAGKTYKYSVKAVKGKKVSKASKKVKATRLKKPTFAVKTVSNGIQAYWKAVKGASKYQVFRKTTGKYAKVATVTAKSYTDKSVVSGTKYTYTVKAVKGKSTSVASAAKSATYLAAVTEVKVTTVKDSETVTVSWNAVKGATAYTVLDEAGKTVADATTTSTVIKPEATNITVFNYTIVATNGAVKSAAKAFQIGFVPKDSYKTIDGNVHAIVTLKAGEAYTFGKDASAKLPKGAVVKVEQGEEGKDVATIGNDYVITAVKAGTTQFKVTFDNATAAELNKLLAAEGYDFGNKLATGVAYVDVTVK